MTSFSINNDTLQFGSFVQMGTVCSQEVGRIALSDSMGALSAAHALRVNSQTLLGMALMLPILGTLLTRILYGVYQYKHISGQDFLISDQNTPELIFKKARDPSQRMSAKQAHELLRAIQI